MSYVQLRVVWMTSHTGSIRLAATERPRVGAQNICLLTDVVAAVRLSFFASVNWHQLYKDSDLKYGLCLSMLCTLCSSPG